MSIEITLVLNLASCGTDVSWILGAAVCKIQARKRYVESVPSVLKMKEATSVKVKRSSVQLLLDYISIIGQL